MRKGNAETIAFMGKHCIRRVSVPLKRHGYGGFTPQKKYEVQGWNLPE